MRRRIALTLLTAALAMSAPAAQYMDCFPAKVLHKPNPADTRCVIDIQTQDCLLCYVTVTIE